MKAGRMIKLEHCQGQMLPQSLAILNTKAHWERLARRWRTRLKEFKLNHPFHMRALRNDAPYNTWTQTKRNKFRDKLIKLARDETWFVVGAAVPVRDYDDIVPQWLKDEDQHPYFFCFRLFLDAVLHLLKTQVDPILGQKTKAYRKDREQVAFIFDEQEEFKQQALRTYYGLKDIRDTDDRLGPIAFGTRDTYAELQAADLMAYYGRRIVSHMIKGEAWRDPIERSFEERHNLMIYMYNRAGLTNWVDEVSAVREARLKAHKP